MKTSLGLLLCAALSFLQAPAQAQARSYDQAELDALLAPIALYPDPLLSQILMAATYPGDVAEAARWSRANPHLKGEQAVRAVAGEPWDASVKSLVAFPEILARMDESPRWTLDLGDAFLAQEPQVMDTVQGLRRRAQASGHLSSNAEQHVLQQGRNVVVQPVYSHVVYVPYYNPYVVYGPWWWHSYHPVYWRPWRPAPVMVSASFFFANCDWRHRHVRVVHRPAFVHVSHAHVVPGRWQHRDRIAYHHRQAPSARAFVRVPESQRQPIVRSLPPAQRVETPRREQQRIQPRVEQRREHRQPVLIQNNRAQGPAPIVQGARIQPRVEGRGEQRGNDRRHFQGNRGPQQAGQHRGGRS